MSSPPALDFPDSDDVPMSDANPGSSNTTRIPLFLAGTPSASGTPRRAPGINSTPIRGITARRALGLQSGLTRGTVRSSSPIHFPDSSSPRHATANPRANLRQADTATDSDVLEFPTSPVKPGAAASPVNRRGDIHSSLALTPTAATRRAAQTPRTLPNANANLASDHQPPSVAPTLSAQMVPSSEPDEIRAIWGTTVNLSETMALFRGFLLGFKPKYRVQYDRSLNLRPMSLPNPEAGERVLYEEYLRRMRITGETNLNLDMVNLTAYPLAKKLYGQLVKYPQEVIPAMDQVLKDLMLELADLDQQAGREGMRGIEGEEEIKAIMGRVYKIRPFGVKVGGMRDLNPSDTDTLIALRGLIIRATPILPDMRTAFFRCNVCAHTVLAPISRGKILEPSMCEREVCRSPGGMVLVHNRCEFADRQSLRLQETPDVVPSGQTPATLSACLYDELCDVGKPGDRVVVMGVWRCVPVRVDPRKRAVKSLFKTYLDVVHISIIAGTDGRLAFDRSTRPAGGDRIPGVGGADIAADLGLRDEHDDENSGKAYKEAMLRSLSERPDIYDLLARSLAPSIYAMGDVKKGILLQLFGGTNKSVAKGGGGGGPRYRGDINVLLVGDPGSGKSQVLQYVHKLAPRGVYTSGKSSSAVGLTAYVTRDPDSKQLVLESGALVLSDGGVCCIDEFDKMSDATRSVLHEVMEQQTVSIAKAGIITTLNARTSILAAANPVGSKYDPELPITRNIDLPPTLISRFDLLYLVLDRVDEAEDRRLARHLVGLYLEDRPAGGGVDGQETLPLDDLASYIEYARTQVNPTITAEAGSELVSSYVAMRSLGGSDKRITATTRQLESMIRLSEAHARMRFSDFVQVQDVREAGRLMREAIKSSAMDPRTGKIDMGLLEDGGGMGAAGRKMREDMRREIVKLLGGATGIKGVKWHEVVRLLGEQSSVRIDAGEFGEVVKELEREGALIVVGERDRRVIRRVDGV